jgi:hypothetical protein
MKLSISAFMALFALAEILCAQGHCAAQEPGSDAWKQLQQHPTTWPAQVRLKAAVQLIILRNGQQVGSIGAPADSMVQLLAVENSTLRVGVGSAQASIAPDQTDLAERLAVATAPSPPQTNAAPIVARTTSSLPIHPPPPPAPKAPAPALSASATPLPPVSGAPMEFDYTAPSSDDGFKIAKFHFWMPAYTQPLHGLIIMTPGFEGDGRGMTKDGAWQALARKYGLALVGNFFQGGGYERPERGTGSALHDALKQFATLSGHEEVATVPLLLWGVSAGGEFNYNYVVWRPDQVMAFVVNKGGYYTAEEADSHARAVPGLFFLGMTDAGYRISGITSIWKAGRQGGALWALAPQPNSGHEFSKTDPLARIFFEAVLKARLPDDNGGLSDDSNDAPTMKPMQENPGWLGNLATHEIHDDSTDSDIDRTAAWLPDESTADAWKVFVSGR